MCAASARSDSVKQLLWPRSWAALGHRRQRTAPRISLPIAQTFCRASTALAVLGLALACLALGAPAPRAQPAGGGKPSAPTKELIAVLDFEIVGGSKAEASAVTDRLREEMLKTGQVTLVDRSQIEAVLNEQALQQACTSSECAVQVGRILGVRRMVAGKVTKISDKLWQISAQVVDVETTETLRAETVTFEGRYLDLLLTGVSELAAKLAGAAVIPSGPAARGRAAVLTDPTGADLILDGQAIAQKSDALLDQLPAGTHTVVANKGSLTATANFIVNPGSLTRVELKLAQRQASLHVNSTPLNATVRLDGQEVGRTPLVLDVHPGEHTLEVAREGYQPATGTVVANLDAPTTVTVTLLEKDAATLEYEHDRRMWKFNRNTSFYGGILMATIGYLEARAVAKSNARQDDLQAQALASNNVQQRQSLVTQIATERDLGRAYKATSQIGYVTGAIMLGVSIWLQRHPPEPPAASGKSSIQVSALPFGPGGAPALALRWSW